MTEPRDPPEPELGAPPTTPGVPTQEITGEGVITRELRRLVGGDTGELMLTGELPLPPTTATVPPKTPSPADSMFDRARLRAPAFTQANSPAALFGLIRPNGAVILLGLVCALAVIEAIAAALAYRERITSDDWAAVEQVLAAHDDAPVIVANTWLGPSARMYLDRAQAWDSVAYPDLRFERFWLLTATGERPWRAGLRAELEQLPRPNLLAIHALGDLTLHEYQQDIGAQTFALLDSIERVSTPAGRCTEGADQFRCKDGELGVRVLEIDYHARRCLAVELADGVLATVELGTVELGDRIHGHVGFGDFNARLRADPTARLELWIDGAIAGRWVFSDDQGWAAFGLLTSPGEHEVSLRIGTTVGGTWQRDGHQGSPSDRLCVELRGFDSPEGA